MVAQVDMVFMKSRPSKLWSRLVAYALFEGRPLTTRGRWINPVVFMLYRLWFWLPLRNRDPNPIFIFGVGRSGTTVLGTILALHKDVGYLNEPKALWQAALGDDDLIGSYSKMPGRYRMSKTDASPAGVRRLQRYYGAFLMLSGTRRIVDKYPELLFRNGLIDAVFPGARKIVLIRNGVDVCRSIQNWSERNGQEVVGKFDDWWGRDGRKWRILVDELVAPDPAFKTALPAIRTFTRHTDMAAVEWIVSMKEALTLQAGNNNTMLFIRYEDLVADPRSTMAEILRSCALCEDGTMMNYASSTLRSPTVHGDLHLNPMIQGIFDDTMISLGYLPRKAA